MFKVLHCKITTRWPIPYVAVGLTLKPDMLRAIVSDNQWSDFVVYAAVLPASLDDVRSDSGSRSRTNSSMETALHRQKAAWWSPLLNFIASFSLRFTVSPELSDCRIKLGLLHLEHVRPVHQYAACIEDHFDWFCRLFRAGRIGQIFSNMENKSKLR